MLSHCGSACYTWAVRCSQLAAVVAACTTLQGCFLGQPLAHATAAWEDEPSYWTRFQFIPEGEQARYAVENSCQLTLPAREQCSGNGECQPWPDLQAPNGRPITFCKCFRDWADPECRTRRKSQKVAYFISIFGGLFGLDQIYMMNYFVGFAKFATFGGLGAWWVIDIVRIGSSPIYANEYRLAYDLPHWLYVMFTVAFFGCLGYFFSAIVYKAYRRERAAKKLLMQETANYRKKLAAPDKINPEDACGNPTFASYPVPTPWEHANGYGALPGLVKDAWQANPYSPWAVLKHATRGYLPPGKFDPRAQPRNAGEFMLMARPPMPAPAYPTAYYGY